MQPTPPPIPQTAHPPLSVLKLQQDQRRHVTPRSPDDFAMRTGVPDEFLHGDGGDNNYTPDWAPSLEERFQNTVKAWLRRGPALAKEAAAAAATTASTTIPSGMAFVPSPIARGTMDIRSARANDRQIKRWTSLSEFSGSNPRSSRPPAFARRAGHGSCPSMLLGLRSRGFPTPRRRFFSGAASSGSSAGQTSKTNGVVNVNGDAPSSDAIAVDVTIMAGTENTMIDVGDVGVSVQFANAANEAAAATLAGSLEAPAEPANPHALFTSLLGGAADVYDSAVSFVGCALVTSPLGKRYLNAYDGHHTVPASAMRDGRGPSTISGSAYDLVGFSNIDPFEASGRRGGGASSRLLER